MDESTSQDSDRSSPSDQSSPCDRPIHKPSTFDAGGLLLCVVSPLSDAVLPFLKVLADSDISHALHKCSAFFQKHGFGILLRTDASPFENDEFRGLVDERHRSQLEGFLQAFHLDSKLTRLEQYVCAL